MLASAAQITGGGASRTKREGMDAQVRNGSCCSGRRRNRRASGFRTKHDLEERRSQRWLIHQGRAGGQRLRLQGRQCFSVIELERGAERYQELRDHRL